MNEAVTQWALSLHGNGFVDQLMVFFSKLGKGGFIFWLIVLAAALYYYLRKKEKRKAVLTLGFFVALGITFVLVDFILKPIAKESRPFTKFPEIITFMNAHNYKVPDDYSFPSGHAAAAFLAVAYLMMIDKKSLWITLPLALIIAFSRIYIGAHYLGDVLFGAGIGLMLGVLLYFPAKFIASKLIKNPENVSHAA